MKRLQGWLTPKRHLAAELAQLEIGLGEDLQGECAHLRGANEALTLTLQTREGK